MTKITLKMMRAARFSPYQIKLFQKYFGTEWELSEESIQNIFNTGLVEFDDEFDWFKLGKKFLIDIKKFNEMSDRINEIHEAIHNKIYSELKVLRTLQSVQDIDTNAFIKIPYVNESSPPEIFGVWKTRLSDELDRCHLDMYEKPVALQFVRQYLAERSLYH